MKADILKLLLPFLALFSLVLSSPIEARQGDKEPLPDLARIKRDFTAPGNGNALFWTFFAEGAELDELTSWANGKGLSLASNSYPDGYLEPDTWAAPPPNTSALREFFNNISRVYAEGCSGPVYLITGDDGFPLMRTIFWTVEFPALMDNTNVPEVRQIKNSPRPNDPKTEYTVFWKRGDPIPTPP